MPIALMGAALAVFIALAINRPDASPAPPAEGELARADRQEEGGGSRPARPSRPGLGRSLPRFVQSKSNAGGPPTIQGDLLEESDSRQSADALMAKQTRDETWAPRMEQHLGERLGPAALDRLGLAYLELRVVGLECRAFGCQLTIEWSPDALAARAPPPFAPATGPLRHLQEQSGPLAAALMRRAREPAGNRRMRETYLLFWRDDLREPSAWLASR
jgi:hypothetical protein